MYLIPLIATLMSSIFCGGMPIISRSIGQRGATIFSILSLVIAFISSSLIWIDLYIGGTPVWLDLCGEWITVGTVSVGWTFYYDLLTAHMLLTVTSVSLAVHIYAVVYMRSDPHLSLFMSYLSLFTFFMLVYVCGDNLLIMLIGWEGIGICSYLLIGYYSHRLAAVKSAQKAILVNRVSDGMLLWGLLWIWYNTGSLEYDLVLLNPTSNVSMFLVISVLIGAMGKSAQILFHVWLADAMEGKKELGLEVKGLVELKRAISILWAIISIYGISEESTVLILGVIMIPPKVRMMSSVVGTNGMPIIMAGLGPLRGPRPDRGRFAAPGKRI